MQRQTSPSKYSRGFGEAMSDKGYYKGGRYWNAIKSNVLPFFPKERIYVVVCEWMRSEIQDQMNRLFSFLGVHPRVFPVVNVAFADRDKPVSGYRSWMTESEPLDGELRDKLLRLYAEDNRRLFKFLGFPVKEWRY